MPFSIRPFPRFPECCPVTYHCGDFEGHGTVWNVSLTGWRFSGNLTLRVGQSFPMTVTLPDGQIQLYVTLRAQEVESVGTNTISGYKTVNKPSMTPDRPFV